MTLEEQATLFAQQLTKTVHAVSPESDSFTARTVAGSSRFSVRQEPNQGIALNVQGEPHLLLKVSFECTLDGAQEYMAIEKSTIKVFAATSRQPIFRYEYERNAATVPAAHVHVHAHRDAFTYLMARSGTRTPRAKRRVQSNEVPKLEDVHFAVGGHRFRPCLEDVLHMLIDEFGVDTHHGTIEALDEGRIAWRRKQVRSVVRDDPESAADALRSLGYDVRWPGPEPEPHVKWNRLKAR